MEINRKISTLFEEYLQIFPATGIIGPRQVGKTTLARQMAGNDNFLYLDLETQTDRDKLYDPVYFLSQFSERCIILDEIQFMPSLFADLRGIIDANRRPGRFIILGSAAPHIIRNSADTLAGRVGYLELSPFNLTEVENEQQLWLRGGFPLSYLATTDRVSNTWRRNFIQTYIQRDLGLLGLNTDLVVMDRFWRMQATAQGNLLNAENFARSLDVSRPTIMRYIEFLEGSFMLRVLRPWFRNMSKRLVKSPKIYIRDSGLLHNLLGLNDFEGLINHVQVGASWEGFVIEQIINCMDKEIQPWFYRTQHGTECDLLLERNGKIVAAIEIKLGTNPKASKGFYISMEDTGAKRGFIIGAVNEVFKTRDNITVCSLSTFVNEILPEL